jgi:hypothetical protein
VAELGIENLELYIICRFAVSKQITRGQAKCNSYMVFFLFAYLMSFFFIDLNITVYRIAANGCVYLHSTVTSCGS